MIEPSEDDMRNLLLLTAGTIAFLSGAAMLTPRSDATPMAPTTLQMVTGNTSLVEQARMVCTHRRVCRQGAGCAWRKVCKRW
jgi:hypothetical protein